MLAFVPAELAVDATVGRDFLLEVEADAVLDGGGGRVSGDVGCGSEAGEELLVLEAVVAHVGVVDEAEDADGAFAFG